jgi:hypothetical protein
MTKSDVNAIVKYAVFIVIGTTVHYHWWGVFAGLSAFLYTLIEAEKSRNA